LVECTFTVKIRQLPPKIFLYLDVSTATGSLHQKNENIISSSGSWHSKQQVCQENNRTMYCFLGTSTTYWVTEPRTGWRNVFILL